MIRRLAAFAALLLLTGCLVSDGDLISPGEADFPVEDGTRFTVYALDESGERADEPPEQATVTVKDGRYLMDMGEESKLFAGLMKEIGPELYAVMIREADQTNGNFYALMERDREDFGETFILFPNPTDGHWVRAIFGESEPAATDENRQVLMRASVRGAWDGI